MDENKVIDESSIDQIVDEAKKATEKSGKDILEDLKKEKSEIKNEGNKNKLPLGDLGEFEKVTSEESDLVLDKIPGVIFKLQNCLFRVCYINKGKKRFTAELINGK